MANTFVSIPNGKPLFWRPALYWHIRPQIAQFQSRMGSRSSGDPQYLLNYKLIQKGFNPEWEAALLATYGRSNP